MANLGQMQTDLNLIGMANLNSTDVTTLLNKCQREEVESWDWSFTYTNIVINSNVGYSTGGVTISQNSTQVIGTGGATFTSSMVGWYLWVGATLTTPVLISAYVSPTQLTLSAPWVAPAVLGSTYILQPLYYDVSPLIEVVSVRQIDYLTQTSREALNRIDPSRISTGGSPSLRWAQGPFLTNTSTSLPTDYQIELWPRPDSALPYLVEGKAGAITLVNSSDNPQIPSAVLEAKASMYLCRASFASNGNPKWLQLADTYKTDYERELLAARTADERRKVTLGKSASGASMSNLGIDFLYDHDVAGPPYVGGNE